MKNLHFYLLVSLLLSTCPQTSTAQKAPEASPAHRWTWFGSEERADFRPFYFYWGYNRASFSNTNLHFTGPNYDFTLYDLRAKDRPSKFGLKKYFSPATLWIPQYCYRLGFYLNPKWALSFGLDHMKYVVDANQSTILSGIITEKASTKYAGTYLNAPIDLKDDFLRFEHTDGLNLVTFDLERHFPIVRLANTPLRLRFFAGIGGIWVVTRTDVRVFGDGLNNDFHVAGFTMAGKTGFRLYFLKRFFLMAETKVGYMALPSVLIKNAAPEIADHNLVFWEKMGGLGFNFRFYKKRRP